jgi:hypothetical protein
MSWPSHVGVHDPVYERNVDTREDLIRRTVDTPTRTSDLDTLRGLTRPAGICIQAEAGNSGHLLQQWKFSVYEIMYSH